MLHALRMLGNMRNALLYMLEIIKGELCLLEVQGVMQYVLLCILETAKGWLCLLEVEVLVELEVVRYVLLCLL